MGQSGAFLYIKCLFLYSYQAYDLYTLLVILIIFRPSCRFSLPILKLVLNKYLND